MPFVSVIVPVYNAERYVADAIKSIQMQSFEDWELILVDDCSLDGSLSICREYAQRDSRIKVLQNGRNSGAATSRNIGIADALGRYLSFIDADDTVESCFLEKLVATAEHFKADVVWCNYQEYNMHNKTLRRCCHNLPVRVPLDKKFILSLFFVEPLGLGSMWNKLYRASFIKNQSIQINTKRARAEDWEFNLTVFTEIQNEGTVVAIDDCLYNYRRQTNSVMSNYREDDYLFIERSYNLLQDIADSYDIDYNEVCYNGKIACHYIEHLCSGIVSAESKCAKLRYKTNTEFAKKMQKRLNIECLPTFYRLIHRLLQLRMYLLVVVIVLIKHRLHGNCKKVS